MQVLCLPEWLKQSINQSKLLAWHVGCVFITVDLTDWDEQLAPTGSNIVIARVQADGQMTTLVSLGNVRQSGSAGDVTMAWSASPDALKVAVIFERLDSEGLKQPQIILQWLHLSCFDKQPEPGQTLDSSYDLQLGATDLQWAPDSRWLCVAQWCSSELWLLDSLDHADFKVELGLTVPRGGPSITICDGLTWAQDGSRLAVRAWDAELRRLCIVYVSFGTS